MTQPDITDARVRELAAGSVDNDLRAMAREILRHRAPASQGQGGAGGVPERDPGAAPSREEVEAGYIGSPAHVALWDAIGDMIVASGGDAGCTSTGRQLAVARVEKAVAMLRRPAAGDGGAAVLDDVIADMNRWVNQMPREHAAHVYADAFRKLLRKRKAMLQAARPGRPGDAVTVHMALNERRVPARSLCGRRGEWITLPPWDTRPRAYAICAACWRIHRKRDRRLRRRNRRPALSPEEFEKAIERVDRAYHWGDGVADAWDGLRKLFKAHTGR